MQISRREFLKKFLAMAAAGTMSVAGVIAAGEVAPVEAEDVVEEVEGEVEETYPDPGPYFIDGGASSNGVCYATWLPGEWQKPVKLTECFHCSSHYTEAFCPGCGASRRI